MEPYEPGLHTSDMIPGVNKTGVHKIDGNSNHSEPNGAGVSGGAIWATPPPLARWSPLRKFLGSKTLLDWFRIGLNSTQKNMLISLRIPPKS